MEVLIAYVSWGLLTVFWNLLGQVNSVYILAQRIFWSMVFVGIILIFTKQQKEVKAAMRQPQQLLTR